MNEPAMKDRGWERRLKQLFEELRGEDERAVPPFEDVLAPLRGGGSSARLPQSCCSHLASFVSLSDRSPRWLRRRTGPTGQHAAPTRL
jgi:hypothetical protein